jgi:nucleotide-binding universal stress UspA family protein
MIPIHRILVATDFSEPAQAALNWGATLARDLGIHLHLLHVVPEPYAYPWGNEMAMMPIPEILAQSEVAARRQLDELAALTKLPADRTVTKAIVGTPVDQILAYMAAEHIDLVVVGTHGRGLVGHLLLGSVAERIVRRSPVPVLTVHGEARAAAAGHTAGTSA